ncbi:MAG: 4-hydroxy-tetrahydrodipicolinate reductase [Deltaproteobacteria bacterium]|nr:4-hydroxy-tetrahydrodipicolinate reductase [Deltaproteobacteria bacterium]
MIRIGLIGIHGKMGKAIVAEAQERSAVFKVVGGVTEGSTISKLLPNVDVVIDFSLPAGTLENLPLIVGSGKALVIGTTGFSESEKNDVLSQASKIPCVMATNMSVGVNLLNRLAQLAAGPLSDYGIEIVETHHRYKKDAPSGTALTLAHFIQKGLTKSTIKRDIPIHSVRVGDVVGDHTVIFASDGERLELTHRASSRRVFALGALKAAEWVVNQSPGIYSMQDVLFEGRS